MPASDLPAWPLLLGAIVLVGLGVLLTAAGQLIVGLLFAAVGAALAGFGVHQGQKALAAATAPARPAPASEPAKTSSVEDYADPEAVRAIPKPGRTCRECGSPVVEKAAECPTCGSAL